MKTLAALLALVLPFAAAAEVQVWAHYSLKGAGGIRDAAAPEIWKSLAPGGPGLARQGSPTVMPSGPECRRQDYASVIKFEGTNQCYRVAKNLVSGDNFVLEAWAYALQGNDGGLHTVVANGHGGIGFILGQSSDNWVVLVGGIGFTTLAKVQPENWTHLAIVKSGNLVSGWINGEKVCGLPGLGGGVQNFSIGATSPGAEPFQGCVAEVRYSTFQPGKFNPVEDFLLDTQKLKRIQAEGRATRSKLVDSLLKTPGVKVVTQFDEQSAPEDWLIQPPTTRATVQVLPGKDNQSAQILLANGLISRTFLVADASLIAPSAATMSFRNLRTSAEFVRSVRPEVLMTVNGREVKVGGLLGQPVHNYLDRAWIETMNGDPTALGFVGCETGEVARDLPWKPRYGAPETPWPPKGKRLTLHFKSRDPDGLHVSVHYEMYEGIPLLGKQVVVRNDGTNEIKIDRMATELHKGS
jgi:hypothetical protein